MRILDDIDGVTVGVCSSDVKLDKCISHDRHGKVWFWNPHGEWGSRKDSDSPTSSSCGGFETNRTIRFKLDMDEG